MHKMFTYIHFYSFAVSIFYSFSFHLLSPHKKDHPCHHDAFSSVYRCFRKDAEMIQSSGRKHSIYVQIQDFSPSLTFTREIPWPQPIPYAVYVNLRSGLPWETQGCPSPWWRDQEATWSPAGSPSLVWSMFLWSGPAS